MYVVTNAEEAAMRLADEDSGTCFGLCKSSWLNFYGAELSSALAYTKRVLALSLTPFEL